MAHVRGLRLLSPLFVAALIFASAGSQGHAQELRGHRPDPSRGSRVDEPADEGRVISFSMRAERWKPGSVPTTPAGMDLLAIPGRHQAEVHWYSPHAVVKDADLDPTLTDARGARNNREVLAISVPRRPAAASPADTLWISLTYPLDPVGIDLSNAEAIEFWVNDWRDPSVRGAVRLHVDLGKVSEDQMRSPDRPPNSRLDSEDRVPRDLLLGPLEDTGIDGVDNSASDDLSVPLDLGTASEADRAGDDYRPPAAGYAEIDPRRWLWSNGTEGNGRATPQPDTEDLNFNNALDTQGSYFEYTIDLSDANSRYLVSDVYEDFAGTAVPHPPQPDNGWRRYRIPVDDPGRVRFGFPDLTQVLHVRIWVDGIVPDAPEDPQVLRKRPILMLATIAPTPDIRESIGSGAPNPFVSSATFAYRLESPTRVRAVVLDVVGREIAVLEEGDREPGFHAVVWDGRHANGQLAPPGLYFVRASIEGHQDRVWRVTRLR